MQCLFCEDDKLVLHAEKYSVITKRKISYFICRKCKSIHQFPLPEKETIRKYYESYLKIKSKMNPGYLTESNLKPFFDERDKTLSEIGFDKEFFKNNLNVEVGCATGDFLEYMKKSKAEKIIGIDVSRMLLNKIKIKGIRKIHGDLSKINVHSIDNLFMFNILEHMKELNKELKLVKSRLKIKGRLIVEVPLAGIISHFFNKNWRFLMPDEHLHIPSVKGLKLLFDRFGLKIIAKTRFGSGFTKGMINDKIKSLFDKTAKKFNFGDRGTFLVVNK
jgi:SAM-dependent methyltransferase